MPFLVSLNRPMANAHFTVDTHLFRELGELLVGRNSTALVELIKNAYDADATKLVIHGENLDDPKRGVITISDDGIGMNAKQFQTGFLRIASRLKDSGRKSARYRRQYTGAKGIGRLAAHKLARLIEVDSCPHSEFVPEANEILHAKIDWDEIESLLILDEVEESGAVILETETRRKSSASGTTITLRRLRKKWSPTDLVQFQSEIESFRPPISLIRLPKGLVKGESLFDEPVIADIGASDPGIKYELSGDFDTGEDYWPQIAQSSHWVVEVDASPKRKKIKIGISPTRHGVAEFRDAQPRQFEIDHPVPEVGPYFQSRFFIREGGGGERGFQKWLNRSNGIRVYSEGFRVLPYGESQNDWLGFDLDYKTRPRSLPFLSGKGFPPSDDKDEGLQFLSNKHYFGGVFLTASRAPMFRMLVNREGFVPDPSFDLMVDVIRTAVYLSVRVRASGKQWNREQWHKDRPGQPERRLNLKQAVEASVTKASELAHEARQHAATGDFKAASAKIEQAASQFSRGAEASERLMTEGAVLRVLASVGTQMAAFVHEINSILGMSKALEAAVVELEKVLSLNIGQRKKLVHLRGAIEDLRRGIERQASYLTDVISPDARRRRSRQKLAHRFDAGKRLVAAIAARRGVEIENAIPADFKSPPMFQAELTVVFSNLLTNAVKAAGDDGRIRATGKLDREGQIVLKIENTGVAIHLNEAERWFRPFESTTIETDPVLGQGMGMGLPITRNMLEEYGATIQFVPPSRGFATALELTFPK